MARQTQIREYHLPITTISGSIPMLPQMLTTFLDSATAFALPATLLASTVSTVFVVAGWRRRRELLQRQGRPLVADPIELGQTTFAPVCWMSVLRRQR